MPPLPFPVSVVEVVPPPSPTPPVVVEVLPVSVGEVAVVDVLVVEVVVVGVVVVVVVLVDVDVLVLVLEVVVGVDAVEAMCLRQSLPASSAIVLAPWLRLPRRVGLTVTGRVRTRSFNARLALTAAAQFPESTAEEIWSAWPFSAID
jgi:hypothetical protein